MTTTPVPPPEDQLPPAGIGLCPDCKGGHHAGHVPAYTVALGPHAGETNTCGCSCVVGTLPSDHPPVQH